MPSKYFRNLADKSSLRFCTSFGFVDKAWTSESECRHVGCFHCFSIALIKTFFSAHKNPSSKKFSRPKNPKPSKQSCAEEHHPEHRVLILINKFLTLLIPCFFQ